jgi:hypothetical protein
MMPRAKDEGMETRYTVRYRDGCRLVDGRITINEMVSLAEGFPKDAVLDRHAARVLGVGMAMGMPEDLRRLCEQPDVIEEAYRRARAMAPGLAEDAIAWLAVGVQGASSQTIFQRLTGIQLVREEKHPLDAGSFGDCRRLLEAVPAFADRMEEIAAISPAWRRLAEAWADLCVQMDREAPEWRSGVGRCRETSRRIEALAG